MRHRTVERTLTVCAVVAVCTCSAIGVLAAADRGIIVSQKNRQFDPGEVTIQKDRPLVIVNDDGDLLHHAYIESDDFNFDSGDQKPGSRISIVFPVRGDFKVLCGIHPKMKLAVHVR